MTKHDLTVSQDDHIATVTINRPETLNSLTLGAIKELLELLHRISQDPDIRALVITGSGRAFCAGWQLDESGVPGLPEESLGVRQSHLMEEYFNPVIAAFHDLPIPCVAAINGVCAGAGVSIALAADIVVAAKSASFVLTFSPKLGLIPDLGASWKLPRLVGWARAQAATLLGDRISAADAEQWGMIWRCVENDALCNEASGIARRLASGPPGVAREVRHAYHASQSNGLIAQMDYERLRQRELLDRPSFKEGLKAFADKRAANFYPGAA
jgi:2-(1,2-epoxy-1,2-dihydrophenyl)acetyl-CoA isomerase